MARSSWTVVRGTYRGADIRRGLQARVADPLWLLARQWQFGAFQGDDAASPATVELHHSHLPVHTLVAPGGGLGSQGARRLSDADLIEAAVEAEPVASLPARFRMAGEAGLHLLRIIPRKAREQALAELQQAFPLGPLPVSESGSSARVLAALVRGSFDGQKLFAGVSDDPRKLRQFLPLAPSEVAQVGKAWLAYCAARFEPQPGPGHWQAEAMEYRFDLLAGEKGAADVRLKAGDYGGDGLDWQEFDLASDNAKGAGERRRQTLLPTRLGYAGMPAERFWDFEDGQVWFGGMTMEKTSLAQMILAEFATVYSNDWFLLPLRAARGSLVRVERITVHDTFGETTTVAPCAVRDGRGRSWRWFELTGDRSVAQGKAPWLFLPRAAAGGESGRAVERVFFTRDEGANLAWGIEEAVESAAALPIDRRQRWNKLRDQFASYVGRNDPALPDGEENAASAASEAARPWTYRLVTSVPPHWVPYQPEVDANNTVTGRLVRSRMREWDLLGEAKHDLAGARGLVMNPGAPGFVLDEELLRGGLVVERLYQSARAPDGSLRLWAGRRKTPGTGDRPSGRRTDAIEKGRAS